ncbi:MAG TPA: DUF721 domain-containing protein [Acidimicrobiales bacterium]|nr:DUF721 domain-containing protein [Acidimicrobiales bacterium]
MPHGEAPEPPGRSIGESLTGWLAQRGLAQQRLTERGLGRLDGLAAVVTAWPTAAGDELARHARPIRLVGDVLVVAVDHPALVAELTLGAEMLLERLLSCTDVPTVTGIKVIVRAVPGLE